MKRLFPLLFFVSAAMPALAQGIVFEDITLGEALAKARKENKHVFVDVYTDWCGPCKMMASQVFPLKEVGDYFNPRFVSLKVNAEKGDEDIAFANRYGVKAYPTFIILNADGELAHMFAGGVMDLGFIDMVEESFDSDKAFGPLRKKYDAGEREKGFMSAYIQALENTHTADIGELMDGFYGSLSDDDRISEECLFMFEIRHASLGSARERFMYDNRDKFRERFGHERIDAMFRKKYELYFAMIIGGHSPGATAEDIADAGERLESLDLPDAGILPVCQAAALVRISGEGADALSGIVEKALPGTTREERDMLRYLVIPGLKDILGDAHTEELLALLKE